MNLSSTTQFCPFCEEGYENEERCPTHGLALVSLAELCRRNARLRRRSSPERREARWRSPRSLVLGAALLLTAGFLAPLVRSLETAMVVSGVRLATTVAPNLWIIPAVAVALLMMLRGDQSQHRLRSIRFAVALLAALPIASVGYTWRNLESAASQRAVLGLASPLPQPQLAWGAWCIVGAALLTILQARRLGSDLEPSNADAENDPN